MSVNRFKLCALFLAVIFTIFTVGGYAQEPETIATENLSQEPTSDAPAEELQAETTVEDVTPPSEPVVTTASNDSEPKLSKKEQRKAIKEQKNAPLDIPELSRQAFSVSGGQRAVPKVDSTKTKLADSLALQQQDSLTTALAGDVAPEILPDSIYEFNPDATSVSRDSTLMITETRDDDIVYRLTGEVTDTTSFEAGFDMESADSVLYSHNPYIKDTLSLSAVTAISVVAPGFGQFYNQQYWKIPVLYAATGTSLYFGIKQQKKYKSLKNIYDGLYAENRYDRERIDPVQAQMIKHNTWKQLFFGAAIGSYIYFLGDAVVNYPAPNTQIKMATTLSMICPGAGQFYNRSYWRAPIIFGGFASFIYVIDWNTRAYNSYKYAYNQVLNGEASGSLQQLKAERDSARRNRDLSIILTGVFYIFNIIDAHVDAHLKDYDVSDNLAWNVRLEPTINTTYTHSMGAVNSVGMNLSFRF